MEATFAPRVEGRGLVHVVRDDGSEVSWPWFHDRAGIPHDLVHHVVETEFEHRTGLWGRIAGGDDFPAVLPKSTRLRARRRREESVAEQRGVLAAEILAGAVSDSFVDTSLTDADVLRHIRDGLAQHGVEVWPAVTESAVRRSRSRIAELAVAWRATGREGLRVRYPAQPAAEERG